MPFFILDQKEKSCEDRVLKDFIDFSFHVTSVFFCGLNTQTPGLWAGGPFLVWFSEISLFQSVLAPYREPTGPREEILLTLGSAVLSASLGTEEL